MNAKLQPMQDRESGAGKPHNRFGVSRMRPVIRLGDHNQIRPAAVHLDPLLELGQIGEPATDCCYFTGDRSLLLDRLRACFDPSIPHALARLDGIQAVNVPGGVFDIGLGPRKALEGLIWDLIRMLATERDAWQALMRRVDEQSGEETGA